MNVTIRPWQLSDTPALLEAVLASAEELRPWMAWYTREFGTCCGSCGLNDVDDVNLRANLGYWLRERIPQIMSRVL